MHFVGTGVDEEDKGIAFGHGLVGFFSIEGVDEDGELVELGRHLEGGGVPEVLGLGCHSQGSRLEESELGPDLVFAAHGTLLGGLGSLGGFVHLVGLRTHWTDIEWRTIMIIYIN